MVYDRSRLDFGTPSSISRDLRTPAAQPSQSSASASTASAKVSSSASSSSSPIIESSDGVLSKIYGSLVEPEAKRQQWSCKGCSSVFQRDATLYFPPSRQSGPSSVTTPLAPSNAANRDTAIEVGSQEPYCRACYSERFSMGSCTACSKPVLGSTKEDGKFVKASTGELWHGRCWKCISCGEAESDKLALGMTGKPTCHDCFDLAPGLRKDVMEGKAAPGSMHSPVQGSRGRRISPSSTAYGLSGSASRGGMGATIAELSKKFGKPVSERQRGVTSSSSPERRGSPELQPSHSRSNSSGGGGGRMRPLTAQFSGQGFNLAAFQPSTPTLGRSDSRSRSVSPHKMEPSREPTCAKCSFGPFDGPNEGKLESTMVSILREDLHYHSQCFCCGVCSLPMEDSSRSFVRLGEKLYAHPQCAPPSSAIRPDHLTTATSSSSLPRPSSSTSINDHPTHQRETRPSMSHEAIPVAVPASYLSFSSPDEGAQAARRFHSTAGAAPPTRSTLSHQRPSSRSNLASLAVSSSSSTASASGRVQTDKFSKLGGMSKCGGCDLTVSTLEGVPGPRGMRWHRKCLVCSSTSKGKLCRKALDSSARVDEQGQVRCRQCFDTEHSRHAVIFT